VSPVGMRELCSPSTLMASPPPRDVLGCRVAVVAVPLVVIAQLFWSHGALPRKIKPEYMRCCHTESRPET